MDELPEKNTIENSEEKKKGSAASGFVILVIILLVCVLVAYLLSIIFPGRGSDVKDIVMMPNGHETPAQDSSTLDGVKETVIPDLSEQPGEGSITDGEPDSTPREDIEALIKQMRGLNTISEAISSFRLSQGWYPVDIDELIGHTGFSLPENVLSRGNPVRPIDGGDFSPGDFSYLTFVSDIDGSIDGFILISYAGQRETGVTIIDPGELIQPNIFDPPIDSPLIGVAIAIHEGGEPIDLSEYTVTQHEDSEE